MPALHNQHMSMGFLGIHQLSIKKWVFLIEGVFFLLTSPLMGDPYVCYFFEVNSKEVEGNASASVK
jgi:hypothetical protein